MIENISVSGKELSEEILADLAAKVSHEVTENFERKPKLVVVTVGEDQASKVYVRNKEKACEKIGINFENIKFSEKDSFAIISAAMHKLANDDEIDGIIVQLPIVSDVLSASEKQTICNAVPNEKDVDGFGLKSKLAVYEGCKDTKAFYPCTPTGCIKLLDKAEALEKENNKDFTYQGLNALVIGRSDIVGKPVANMLMAKNMTVTVAHSKTPIAELRKAVKHADVIISAVGKQLPVATMHANAFVIIDVGMNRDTNGKLCGDLSEDWKKTNSKFYTPVPGGVGPMTVCMLMSNVVKAWEYNIKKEQF